MNLIVKRIIILLVVGASYFFWFGQIVGIRPEHTLLFVAAAICYLGTPSMRKFAASFTGFILFWLIYDSLRVWPNYHFNTVHIKDLYLFDKQWFGINTAAGRQTLNEYFAAHTSTGLDIMTAMFYLSWVPAPMGFAVWLWFKNKPLFIRFSFGYLFVNLVGFTLYYLFPAAPPWYVEMNGFDLNPDVPRSAAGLENFDRLIGRPLFHTIYQRNSNVFAAIPSLHSAYPLVTLLYARKTGRRGPVIIFSLLCIGIWFSAIYLRHHYVLDVVLGILTAFAGFYLFEFLYHRTRVGAWLRSWIL